VPSWVVTLPLRLPLPLRVLLSGRVPIFGSLTLIRSKIFLPWSGTRVRVGASFVCWGAMTSSVRGGSVTEIALVDSGNSMPGTLLTGDESMLAAWSGTFVAGWTAWDQSQSIPVREVHS